MKPLFLIFLSLVCLGVAYSPNRIWGIRNPSDQLLLAVVVKRPRQWEGIWFVEVNYPEGAIKNTTKTLSAIHVIETTFDRFGAKPAITSGGVGQKHATIALKSHLRRGINTLVQFWG